MLVKAIGPRTSVDTERVLFAVTVSASPRALRPDADAVIVRTLVFTAAGTTNVLIRVADWPGSRSAIVSVVAAPPGNVRCSAIDVALPVPTFSTLVV